VGSAPEENGVQGWPCMDWCWEPRWMHWISHFGYSRQLIAPCLSFPIPMWGYCFHLRLLKVSHPKVWRWELEKNSLFQSLRKG